MTRDDLITRTLKRAGQREDDAKLRTQLEDEIKQIQSELEGGVKCGQQDQGVFFPWFLYKEKSDIAVVANAETIAIPTDFLVEYDEDHVGSLWYYDSTRADLWAPVRKDTRAIIRSRELDSGTTPSYYSVVGNNIYLRPISTAALVLKMAYYGADTVLSTNLENNWTKYAPAVMMTELGVTAGRLTRDANFQAEMVIASKGARDQLYAMHVLREESARQRQRGED